MSTTTLALDRRVSLLSKAADYVELTKPKIAMLELVTVAAAAWLAGLEIWALVHTLLGTALLAASASALNQVLERERDARMPRTARRPLAAGRLNVREVSWGAIAMMVIGGLYLAAAVNGLTAALGLGSWVLYVLVYTPLKTISPANTFVGAVAGAIPVLMGYAAMGRPLDLLAATLFMVIFLWQLPHFMAIAWIYRREYRAAGMRMLPVVDPSGIRAGTQAVVAALMLVPVSLLPAVLPLAGSVYVYFILAMLLSTGQLLCAAAFCLELTESSARRLLRATLIYLPSLMMLLMLTTPG